MHEGLPESLLGLQLRLQIRLCNRRRGHGLLLPRRRSALAESLDCCRVWTQTTAALLEERAVESFLCFRTRLLLCALRLQCFSNDLNIDVDAHAVWLYPSTTNTCFRGCPQLACVAAASAFHQIADTASGVVDDCSNCILAAIGHGRVTTWAGGRSQARTSNAAPNPSRSDGPSWAAGWRRAMGLNRAGSFGRTGRRSRTGNCGWAGGNRRGGSTGRADGPNHTGGGRSPARWRKTSRAEQRSWAGSSSWASGGWAVKLAGITGGGRPLCNAAR
mmetsp:Transcript_145941/g.406548  ORF Transcript_145941/g.406548 Transcript_145941/m.406548 type:complete len:274 (-) Transcript_145941:650-1471(-)